MLFSLKVENLAVVESVEVTFTGGLNVLSGETGAGKTVLVGAMSLLLGDRAEPSLVRAGAGEAVLEAVFDLEDEQEAREQLASLGYLEEGEDELVLWRRIAREGKSRCTVNGRSCPVSTLAEVGGVLVEVHGQNAHQALLSQRTHIAYLDRYAGHDHLQELSAYHDKHALMLSLRAEKERMDGVRGGGARELELLSHEVGELQAAKLVPGELEELEERAGRLRHASELWELAKNATASLADGDELQPSVLGLLTGAARDLAQMARRDSSLSGTASRLESLGLEVEDVAAEIEKYAGALETDPSELAELEARLSVLKEIARKYGGTLESAIEYSRSARGRLEEIESIEERRVAIGREIDEVAAECVRAARGLSEGRSRAAQSLARDVRAQMEGLGLERAAFEVNVETCDLDAQGTQAAVAGLGAEGGDRVEFMFSPDGPGSLSPLRKIASGGEMSRVMLALKIVLAGADRLPVLVYDEVDAGIGGETAGTIAEKLFELTRYHQVFCVTHLPQIAVFADRQYAVVKRTGHGAPRADMVALEGKERVSEICRMLGDATGREATARHAVDILDLAARKKKALRPG